VLLSLITPTFPLPSPWVHVGYRDLAGALDQIDADALGRTSGQFIRYRALIHRLVALAEAVDPAQALDEQFSATDAVAQLPGGGGLDGAIARMRFSGLAHPARVTTVSDAELIAPTMPRQARPPEGLFAQRLDHLFRAVHPKDRGPTRGLRPCRRASR